jgi:phosphohistidine phosphatase SixA
MAISGVISIIAAGGFRLPSHHMSPSRATIAIVIALATAAALSAAEMSPQALVRELQHGGYVIVMRHASSPATPPDAKSANKDNKARERQLDDAGRRAATAMGQAFTRLKIPVGQVLTSPTYRAHETARLAGWTSTSDVAALGDRGRSMQAITDEDADTLRRLTFTDVFTRNRVIITHMPNIARAFPDGGALEDGEALVFKPGDKPALVGRVKIGEWPTLK